MEEIQPDHLRGKMSSTSVPFSRIVGELPSSSFLLSRNVGAGIREYLENKLVGRNREFAPEMEVVEAARLFNPSTAVILRKRSLRTTLKEVGKTIRWPPILEDDMVKDCGDWVDICREWIVMNTCKD